MPRCSPATGGQVLFWCPGCQEGHAIGVPAWTWNGNEDAPTFHPSVKAEGFQWAPGEPFHRPTHAGVPNGGVTVCHSFVTDGRIQFLPDSTHALAGTTVDLPEWPPVFTT